MTEQTLNVKFITAATWFPGNCPPCTAACVCPVVECAQTMWLIMMGQSTPQLSSLTRLLTLILGRGSPEVCQEKWQRWLCWLRPLTYLVEGV